MIMYMLKIMNAQVNNVCERVAENVGGNVISMVKVRMLIFRLFSKCFLLFFIHY